MGLFTFNINYYSDENVLSDIKTTLKKIMANVQELTEAVDGLQTQVDATQAVVVATIEGLNATIADLTNQLANGATPADVQALLEKVQGITADLATTLPA